MKQAAENNDPPGNSGVEGVTWMLIYLSWPIVEQNVYNTLPDVCTPSLP